MIPTFILCPTIAANPIAQSLNRSITQSLNRSIAQSHSRRLLASPLAHTRGFARAIAHRTVQIGGGERGAGARWWKCTFKFATRRCETCCATLTLSYSPLTPPPPHRVVQPGGVPKDTAALAAEVVRGCSDDFLRRTALELLGGVKPFMLQQKLLNVISGLGPEGLSKVNLASV